MDSSRAITPEIVHDLAQTDPERLLAILRALADHDMVALQQLADAYATWQRRHPQLTGAQLLAIWLNWIDGFQSFP